MDKSIGWYCNAPIGISISFIGLIGNIIAITVWKRVINSKLKRSRSTAIYLIVLGICDNCLLVCFAINESLPTLLPSVKKTHIYAVIYCWISFPTFCFFFLWGNWLVVGITLNRYFVVAFPIKYKAIYTTYRTCCGIIGLTLFSALVNLPHFFNYIPKKKATIWNITNSNFGISGKLTFTFLIHCLGHFAIPWMLVAVLNVAIFLKMIAQKKEMGRFMRKKSLGSFFSSFCV